MEDGIETETETEMEIEVETAMKTEMEVVGGTGGITDIMRDQVTEAEAIETDKDNDW